MSKVAAVRNKLMNREVQSQVHGPAIAAAAAKKAAPKPPAKSAPSLQSQYKPPPVAPGPGPKPAAGLVREGINYKDLDPGLQDQVARQAGLVPTPAPLPPGVATPAMQAQAQEANEEAAEPKAEEAAESPAQEAAEEGAEDKSKSDLNPPAGHHAVAAHVRKNPVVSKMGAEKLRKRGVALAK